MSCETDKCLYLAFLLAKHSSVLACFQTFEHVPNAAQCSCSVYFDSNINNTFPKRPCYAFAEYSPYTGEPCPEGTSEEPCPEAETFTEGFQDGFAEGLPEGYEDSTEGVDTELSPEESSPEESQEEGISATYDEGYNEGSAEGYSAGYEIGEEGVGTPEESFPEYSGSGRALIHEKQADFCLL